MDDSVMSLESVRRRSGQFDLSSVRDLDYSAAGVREIANLEPCVSLVRADFSRNKVSTVCVNIVVGMWGKMS